MGAWGVRAFENDTACDWAYGLDKVKNLSLVTPALVAVESLGDESLDMDVACEALAACEVLARLQGNPGYQSAYTETVDAWVVAHPLTPTPQLLKLADRVIDRILGEDSELRELWDEGDEGDTWREAVEDLRSRLTA